MTLLAPHRLLACKAGRDIANDTATAYGPRSWGSGGAGRATVARYAQVDHYPDPIPPPMTDTDSPETLP